MSIVLDKSLIDIYRRLDKYEDGIQQFLDFALRGKNEANKLRCLCRKCENYFFRTRSKIYEHLIFTGFDRKYRRRYHHGESFFESGEINHNVSPSSDGVQEMLHDLGRGYNLDPETDEAVGSGTTCPKGKAATFYKLVEEAEQEIYPGCEKFSKLSFIVQLMNIKCLFGLSGKAMDAILELLVDLLPVNNKVPHKYKDAKKTLQDLGLNYEKIDACVNDCILYRGTYAELELCLVCGVSRWIDAGKRTNGKKNRAKILRYFPLKERLQRLYMSLEIAKEMRWHKEQCPDDGDTRHPTTSEAWKSFDAQHPSFAVDPRNVRLGLASDGFNLNGDMSTSYSVWPVVLLNYNLPPWMCTKDSYSCCPCLFLVQKLLGMTLMYISGC